LRDQEDRISELESSNAKLKASCTTVDAASQTDPTPSQEYEVPTAALDTKKDASCDAQSNNPEAEDNVTNEDQTSVPPYIKPKKKRKPRKNRSRGARSRAKAAAALALLEAETATSTLSTKDFPVPVTEAIATLILTESKVAALVLPTRDISVPAVEVAALSRVTEETPVSVTDVEPCGSCRRQKMHRFAYSRTPLWPHATASWSECEEFSPKTSPFPLGPNHQTGPPDVASQKYFVVN